MNKQEEGKFDFFSVGLAVCFRCYTEIKFYILGFYGILFL